MLDNLRRSLVPSRDARVARRGMDVAVRITRALDGGRAQRLRGALAARASRSRRCGRRASSRGAPTTRPASTTTRQPPQQQAALAVDLSAAPGARGARRHRAHARAHVRHARQHARVADGVAGRADRQSKRDRRCGREMWLAAVVGLCARLALGRHVHRRATCVLPFVRAAVARGAGTSRGASARRQCAHVSTPTAAQRATLLRYGRIALAVLRALRHRLDTLARARQLPGDADAVVAIARRRRTSAFSCSPRLRLRPGFCHVADMIERLERALDTMDSMRRAARPLLQLVRPPTCVLEPPYVSTVDSGNLAGHLIAISAACHEIGPRRDDDTDTARRGGAARDASPIRRARWRWRWTSRSCSTTRASCSRSATTSARIASTRRTTICSPRRRGSRASSRSRRTTRRRSTGSASAARSRRTLARRRSCRGAAACSSISCRCSSCRRRRSRCSTRRISAAVRRQIAYGARARRAVGNLGVGVQPARPSRHLSVSRVRRARSRAQARPRERSRRRAVCDGARARGRPARCRCANLAELERAGALGAYGFHDALDYTRPEPERSVAVVRTFMAHHVGMSLVALDNALTSSEGARDLAAALHGRSAVRAAALLLDERIPRRYIAHAAAGRRPSR